MVMLVACTSSVFNLRVAAGVFLVWSLSWHDIHVSAVVTPG